MTPVVFSSSSVSPAQVCLAPRIKAPTLRAPWRAPVLRPLQARLPAPQDRRALMCRADARSASQPVYDAVREVAARLRGHGMPEVRLESMRLGHLVREYTEAEAKLGAMQSRRQELQAFDNLTCNIILLGRVLDNLARYKHVGSVQAAKGALQARLWALRVPEQRLRLELENNPPPASPPPSA